MLHPHLRPSYRWATKLFNTFAPRPIFWGRANNPQYWARQLNSSYPTTLGGRTWRKLTRGTARRKLNRWFHPILTDTHHWATQSAGKKYDPQNYVDLLPPSHVLLNEVAYRASGVDAPILDLGCNCGRHLYALDQRGFTNLHGVDIGRDALEHMDIAFPGLSDQVHTTCALFQQCLLEASAGQFEIIFTHGATVELVHPSFPLVRHMARATQRYVVLLINENGHKYPRFWEHEFNRNDFLLVKLLRPAVPDSLMSLLVFERCV